MVVSLCVQSVGQFASGKVRIAAAYQYQVAGETAVGIEHPIGFDRGVETVVRPNQSESRSGGEKLGVGSRSEKLIRIAGVKGLASRERDDFDAPESARQVGRS